MEREFSLMRKNRMMSIWRRCQKNLQQSDRQGQEDEENEQIGSLGKVD